jgi:hypothetical protein
MTTAQSNTSGKYSVAIDGSTPIALDGFTDSPSPTCGFSWSASALQDVLHTVVITTQGQSSAAGSSDGATNFELDGFV